MASTGEPFGLFWDSENGDRTYSAASFEYWLKKFFTSGVFNGDLQVQATSGMTVKVGAGYANVDGKVKFWNAEFNLTLSAANSTYPRIDTIVITRDNVNRQITCEVVTGAYTADEPQPTAPVRNPEIYQLVLAQIYVAAGATGITQSDITDTRTDTDLCGYITGTVTEMDFSQFTAQFEAYFAEYKLGFEADMSEWESSQQASYATWFNSIVQQYISDKSDWDSWYADLQATLHMLPQDSAEYLQVEINELRDLSSGSIINIDTIEPTLIGQAVTLSSEDGLQTKSAVFEKYRNKLENEGESETINGITFTVNADGTVTANGTASAEARFYINESFTAANGDVLNGCPENGSAVSYQLRVGTSTDDTAVGIDVGSGYTMSAGTYKISINIASGRTVNNLVFKPMVRDAADSDEYEKYNSAKAHATINGVTFIGDLGLTSTDTVHTAVVTLTTPYFSRYHAVMAFWIANVNIQGDENLYGATITVKDSDSVTVGTVTLSALDGTGSIEITKADTYTFNYSYDGEDYSVELVVDEETTYSVELATGFMWARWVTLGGLDPTDYTDLDDVFDDEAAVRRLMTVHASADYLIDYVTDEVDIIDNFTANDTAMKWIGLRDYVCDGLTAITGVEAKLLASTYWERYLKDHVPTMTSNTAPYGTASANSNAGNNYYPYKAFDNSDSSIWANGTTSASHSNTYVGYAFTNPVCIRRVYVHFQEEFVRNVSYKIQGSNDNSSWTDVSSSITTLNGYIDLDNDDYFLYYRLYITSQTLSSSVTGGRICTLQFYGRSLNVSVPIMTSNTAPYGLAGGDADTNSYLAFDNNNSTSAASEVGLTSSIVWYKFTSPIKVKKVEFLVSFSSAPSSISAQVIYSDDGATWNDATQAITVANNTKKLIDVNVQDGRMYWGIRRITSEAKANVAHTINFYGVDYSEREFAEGSTMKYLYDHGLKLNNTTFDRSMVDSLGSFAKENAETLETKTVGGQTLNYALIWTNNTIDMSVYTKLCRRSTRILDCAITSNSLTLAVNDSKIQDIRNTLARVSTNNYGYQMDVLDISAINANEYIMCLGTWYNTTGISHFECNELWLE